MLEYADLEADKTNWYLFMKHGLPELYRSFQGIKEQPAPKKVLKTNFLMRKIKKFANFLKRNQHKDIIEVFDVLIRANRRLNIYDSKGYSILASDEYFERLRA